MFEDDDLSSPDFVKRCDTIRKEADNDNEDNQDLLASSSSKETNKNVTKKGRKSKRITSGRKRALLAWERNLRAGVDEEGIAFGEDGWPPPFRQFVQEMRELLIKETGRQRDWDEDDIAMLRKYFYLKHNIQSGNMSTITVHVKVATMSPRCYLLAQKIMDLYQSGQLERKRKDEKTSLSIHASYFDFLYNYSVTGNEIDVFNLLNKVLADKKRPDRKVIIKKPRAATNSADERLKKCRDDVMKAKARSDEAKRELMEIKEKNITQQLKISELKEVLKAKELEMQNLNEILKHTQKDHEKAIKDCDYLAATLASNRKELLSLKREYESLKLKEDSNSKMNPSSTSTQVEASSTIESAIDILRSSHKKKKTELQQHQIEYTTEEPEKEIHANEDGQDTLIINIDEVIDDNADQNMTEDVLPIDIVEEHSEKELDISVGENQSLQVRLGDWVAVDYETASFIYIGKVTEVDEISKTVTASFLKKQLDDE